MKLPKLPPYVLCLTQPCQLSYRSSNWAPEALLRNQIQVTPSRQVLDAMQGAESVVVLVAYAVAQEAT